MSNVYAAVATGLEVLELPVMANRDRDPTKETLPDVFLVFFVVDDSPVQHADDTDILHDVLVDVNYFDRNGLDEMPDIDGAMKAIGFQVSGKREIPYSIETGHFGRNCSYKKVEEN